MARPKVRTTPKSDPRLCHVVLVAPAVIAVVLASPCILFRYLSDDFAFMQRGAVFNLQQLVPDLRSMFYRPISRELYFALLSKLSPTEPLLGHILNAAFLGIAVLLLTLFGRRLGGPRFGALAGAYLACLGSLPILVGWVSTVQDLLAMVFVGAALHFEWSGRRLLAILSAAAALLSKETAIFFLPALVALHFIMRGGRRELALTAAQYLALVLAWVLVHPRLRDLLAHGLSTGEGGYVGLDNPSMLGNALKMAATFLNIPPTVWDTQWPSWVTVPFVVALGVVALVAWAGARCAPSDSEAGSREILWIGAWLGIIPAIATVMTTKHWFPYYAAMPAMGMSILAAFGLEKLGWKRAMVSLAIFAFLGSWYRGTNAGKITLPAEANMRQVSTCLAKLEKHVRELRPAFPDSSRIYLAVELPPERNLRHDLLDGQGLRVWYGNRTLVTRPVEYQDSSHWPRYLFWVTPSCEVFEITVPGLEVRSAEGRPNYFSYQRALRSYALGAWSVGDTDRGVAALMGMHEVDKISWDFDRRLAAALLFASGREQEAERIHSRLPQLGRDAAASGTAVALTTYVMRPGLDEAVFRAFGLSYDDPEVFRDLMFYFSDKVLLDKAQRMAERLLQLHPGDEDATAMIAAIRKVPKWQEVLVGPGPWVPPGVAY